MGACPKLLGLDHVLTKHTAARNGWVRARYWEGGTPTIARKVRLNVARLSKPTAKQASVTLYR